MPAQPSRFRFTRPLPRRTLLLAAGGALVHWPFALRAQQVVTVAAASNLKFALEELAEGFEKSSGHKLRLVFGSSGQFYSQILQGAPFHVFLSADESFALKLFEAKRTLDRGRVYAQGRIGLLVPKSGPIVADPELKDLAAALKDGRLQRLAIANPEHAPYGMLAVEALQHAGLYAAIQKHLVFGENVSQAAQFALSGSTQGGIVAYSLALAPSIAAQSQFALIDARWHRPLLQRVVVLNPAPPAAKAFYDYVATPAAQALMRRHGFAQPSP